MKQHNKKYISKMAAAALAFSLIGGGAALADEPGQMPATTPIQDAVESVERAAEQNATQNTGQNLTATFAIQANPLVPLPLIAGLGLAYGGFCLWAARRRMRGAWLRAAVGGTLVVTMVNPEFLQEQREMMTTIVPVVVDNSPSQKLGDRAAMTAAAYEKLVSQLSAIGGVEVRMIEVGGTMDRRAADGTALFSALDAALVDIPRDRLGAVIMLTDGQVHDVPENHPAAVAGVPFHMLVSGHENETDRRIVVEQAPRFGLVDQEQTLRFRVIDDGVEGPATETVRVTISNAGEEISTHDVLPGELTEVTLNIPHVGTNLIELRAEELPGELTMVNNRTVAPIEGIRSELNVLLVSGEPHAGTRMWRDLLKSDPNTNLVHFTILRPPVKQDGTPLAELSLIPIPTDELFVDKIKDFDLIVLDHFENSAVLSPQYLRSIANYVEEGGALLVVSGAEFSGDRSIYNTPLSAVLPAAPTGTARDMPYAPRLTDDGMRHPVTRTLPGAANETPGWGRWTRIIDSDVTRGHVVMQGQAAAPLLVLSREGQGRVAMLQSDSAWLWARGHEGGGPYAAMLGSTAHWLMKDRALEEEALRMRHKDGQLIVEQQTMEDQPRPITITTPSGEELTVTPEAIAPGIWNAALPADHVGLYSAAFAGEEQGTQSFINIGPANPREYQDTLSTLRIVQPFSEATGGLAQRMSPDGAALHIPQLIALGKNENIENVAEGAMGIRMSDASVLRGADRTPIIPPWAGMALALLLLGGAYYREGDKSLFKKKAAAAPPETAPKEPPPAPSGPAV